MFEIVHIHVGDRCWWQVWDFGDRFTWSISSPLIEAIDCVSKREIVSDHPTLYLTDEWIKRPLVLSGHSNVLVLFLSRTQMVRSRFSTWWVINIPNKWTRFSWDFQILETTIWNFRKLKVLIPIPYNSAKTFDSHLVKFRFCHVNF